MPIIACPHCGARRNTPPEKLPKHKTMASCPACREKFVFDPASEQSVAQPADGNIVCPHCQFPRQRPDHRQLKPGATFSCRRCKQSFRLAQNGQQNPPRPPRGTSTQAAEAKLQGIGSLLTGSWELFCQRGWSLLGIYLLTALLVFGPLLLAAFILPQFATGSHLRAWTCLFLGLGYLLVGLAWMTAAVFHYTVDPAIRIKTACSRAKTTLWQFVWLLLLLGLLVAGGSLLLVIPGVVFMIWFLFCQYILAEQGIGGLQALQKSHQLVRGHWWAVFGRFLLLLMISSAISALASRLPIIGAPLNLGLTLLLTPFSTLYYYLLYKDLQRCQAKPSQSSGTNNSWGYVAVAFSGWLLISGAVFLASNQTVQQLRLTKPGSPQEWLELFTEPEKALAKLTREQNAPALQFDPQPLSAEDYDRLLSMHSLPENLPGHHLGPALLTAERFWSDEQNPHMWLEVQLAELPNLALSARRSARILIDQVLDQSNRNQYAQEHSYENQAFEWIQIRPNQEDRPGYSGIRNIYLKQGARPEQIRSIRGQLELNLPLGIESLRLSRKDVGREIQIAGLSLQIEALDNNRIALSYQGSSDQLLSIQAADQQEQPLRQTGSVWQASERQTDLQQMFNGEIDSVTILVAADSIKRSYPFEITR